MSLPTDILDLILHTALRVCSQSHRTLSQLAERYLYAHISIGSDGAIKSDEIQVGNKLTAIFSRRPRIANYVHSFEMDMAYNSTPWDLTLSEGLLPILSSFPALTKITSPQVAIVLNGDFSQRPSVLGSSTPFDCLL